MFYHHPFRNVHIKILFLILTYLKYIIMITVNILMAIAIISAIIIVMIVLNLIIKIKN